MDVEDETAVYLNYLNDAGSTNSYLLSNSVELSDALPFSDIGGADWPAESLPILLNASLITECDTANEENNQFLNGTETLVETIGVQTDCENDNEQLLNTFIPVENNDMLSEEMAVVDDEAEEQNELTNKVVQPTTYINYSPIVKENADGNKEIYLTEKDINNDASVIQLYHPDGSVITIDKSILSMLNCPMKNGQSNKQKPRDYTPHYTAVIVNKCKICNELFENEKDVKRHLDQKHAEVFHHEELAENGKTLPNTVEKSKKYTIYLCSICRLAFSERDLLKEHMISNHLLSTSTEPPKEQQETPSNPKVEDNKSVKVLANILIKQQEKAKKRFLCKVNKHCKLRFPNAEILKKHEESHIGENRRQFKCLECDQRFTIWRICSNHYWKVHKIDLGLFSCPVCDKYKHHSSAKVMKHMAIHNEERPFMCSECGKSFKTMLQLRNHEIIHKKPEDIPNWSVIKRCDICERFFANAKSLKYHIQSVHENFKPFVCNICGHKTTRKAQLELHMRQHTGQKPHECSLCSYRSSDPNCLKRHIMSHIGLRKYKCPHCLYTSIQSNSMKNHMMRKHPGKEGPYKCNYCPYTFLNMSTFITHIKCHNMASGTPTENGTDLDTTNNSTNEMNNEDDETHTLLTLDNTIEETVIDTGGITIPAEFELIAKE